MGNHPDLLDQSNRKSTRRKLDVAVKTDLNRRATNLDQEGRSRSSTLMRYDAVVPCGICRKSFDAALPQALFAHLAGHFDRRYIYNRCEACQINFVSMQDLRAHLKSVVLNRTCGYMFNHNHPCGGHHPPRRRPGRGIAPIQQKAAADKDSDRFDFCYRLRGWEHAQLASYGSTTPTTAASPKAAHITHWGLQHTGLLRMSFLNSSRTSHSTCSTPVSYAMAGQQLDNGMDGAANPLGAALLRAICTGSVELVGAFIYAGANVNFRDTYGFGPMHYAARYGSPGIIRLLIRTGASVDDHDRKGESPLTHAIQAGICDLAECFICLGAALQEDHIAHAISAGDRSVLEMLLRYWRRSGRPDETLDPSLLAAIKQRDRRVVDVLLRNGAHASAEDDAGNTALTLAVETGDKEIAQLLLDYGAQPDCSPGMQYNLLVDALKYRHLAMVELLLSKEVV